jgi:mannose-6-phosphate isomerase
MNTPLHFHPYLRPLVWGGRRLAELGKALPTDAAYGESWELSDHPSHRSIVAVGPYTGRSLRALVEQDAEAILGPGADARSPFPWLVKFLDARDWLSVQVHPDEDAVRSLWPGEGPKTEAWFILGAAPGSRIYAGLLPGVDEKALRAAISAPVAGTVADCLHQFEPRSGDCLFLPAGTVHAVGGGVLMAEVQQTSDATFRLFDWNRRDASGKGRDLHIEQALASIHWKSGPVQPTRATGYVGGPGGDDPVWQGLVRCPYFHLDYLRQREPFAWTGGALRVLIVVHGQGALHAGGETFALHKGATWLLPASLAEVRCAPGPGGVGLLVSTLPQ